MNKSTENVAAIKGLAKFPQQDATFKVWLWKKLQAYRCCPRFLDQLRATQFEDKGLKEIARKGVAWAVEELKRQGRFHFGKHAGEKMSDCPADYLGWLMAADRLDMSVAKTITKVLTGWLANPEEAVFPLETDEDWTWHKKNRQRKKERGTWKPWLLKGQVKRIKDVSDSTLEWWLDRDLGYWTRVLVIKALEGRGVKLPWVVTNEKGQVWLDLSDLDQETRDYFEDDTHDVFRGVKGFVPSESVQGGSWDDIYGKRIIKEEGKEDRKVWGYFPEHRKWLGRPTSGWYVSNRDRATDGLIDTLTYHQEDLVVLGVTDVVTGQVGKVLEVLKKGTMKVKNLSVQGWLAMQRNDSYWTMYQPQGGVRWSEYSCFYKKGEKHTPGKIGVVQGYEHFLEALDRISGESDPDLLEIRKANADRLLDLLEVAENGELPTLREEVAELHAKRKEALEAGEITSTDAQSEHGEYIEEREGEYEETARKKMKRKARKSRTPEGVVSELERDIRSTRSKDELLLAGLRVRLEKEYLGGNIALLKQVYLQQEKAIPALVKEENDREEAVVAAEKQLKKDRTAPKRFRSCRYAQRMAARQK